MFKRQLEDITIEGVTDVLNKREIIQKQFCCLQYVCTILWEAI